jgi:hypothetical protein
MRRVHRVPFGPEPWGSAVEARRDERWPYSEPMPGKANNAEERAGPSRSRPPDPPRPGFGVTLHVLSHASPLSHRADAPRIAPILQDRT